MTIAKNGEPEILPLHKRMKDLRTQIDRLHTLVAAMQREYRGEIDDYFYLPRISRAAALAKEAEQEMLLLEDEVAIDTEIE